MSEVKCFKIRDTETGLWSTGGVEPRFNKTGKAWSQIGHVKNHLAAYLSNIGWRNRVSYETRKATVNIPANWEVVEFVISTTESIKRSAREVYGRKV